MSEAQKWYVNLYGSNQGKVYVGPLGHVVGVAEVNTICGMDQALKDAQLIVDAVNDLQTLRDERDRLRANLINCSERLAAYYGDNYPAVVDARAALTPAGGGKE